MNSLPNEERRTNNSDTHIFTKISFVYLHLLKNKNKKHTVVQLVSALGLLNYSTYILNILVFELNIQQLNLYLYSHGAYYFRLYILYEVVLVVVIIKTKLLTNIPLIVYFKR
jgi:hypothetical protein